MRGMELDTKEGPGGEYQTKAENMEGLGDTEEEPGGDSTDTEGPGGE